tara:strand:- start:330 stop:713 length:384 start_codon:yes stop_codon:yes gene_type:complete
MKNLKYAFVRFDFLDQDEIKTTKSVLLLQKIEKGSRNNGVEYYKVLKIKSSSKETEENFIGGEIIHDKNRERLFFTVANTSKVTGNKEPNFIVHISYQKDVDRDIYTGFALYDNIAETSYSEFQFVN